MKELKNFIKDLKILYIEDETDAREVLTKTLRKISDNVDTCDNGINAYIKYKDSIANNSPYQLIITDINMPKMNGIELVKKIKETDFDLPIIFTTARNEKDILFEALDLNISSFMVKPIDFTLLFHNIEKIAQKLYYKKQFFIKQKELETYTKIIENVAVISKTDNKGYITYVDDAFCEVTGYKREELIGQNHNIVRHPDNPKEVYEKLWSIIQKGQVWEGKARNIDKQGNPWYAKSTIVPVYNDKHDEIIEYIAIRFLITEEQEEKRELNSKLIKNTIFYKKQIGNYEQKIQDLQKQIGLQNSIMDEFKIRLEKVTQSKNKLLSQISEYEHNDVHSETTRLNMLKKKNEELQMRLKTIDKLKEDKEKQQETIRELEHKIEVKDSMLDSYKQNITQYKVQLGELKKEKEKKAEKKGFFG